MNITVIQFSSSGNTAKVASAIREVLEEDGTAKVQVIDLARDAGFFGRGRAPDCLSRVEPHDVLMVGGPVLAQHLQYHVQDLIKALPAPDGGTWGSLAIPFVTYGGISSGIALKEAGRLLRRSGRTVVGGLKVSAAHRMTRAFLEEEFNAGKPNGELRPVVLDLRARLQRLARGEELPHGRGLLEYRPWLEALAIRLIFDEKKWHRERYPKIRVDRSRCTNCGACAKLCPVLHLQKDATGVVVERAESDCIHCLGCAASCPKKAIELLGDLEKGRAFMKKAIADHAGTESPASCLY